MFNCVIKFNVDCLNVGRLLKELINEMRCNVPLHHFVIEMCEKYQQKSASFIRECQDMFKTLQVLGKEGREIGFGGGILDSAHSQIVQGTQIISQFLLNKILCSSSCINQYSVTKSYFTPLF